jgi:hypothetical protein
VSRPKETSLGRGRGRCGVLVSSFGGSRGEASGDVEGEEAPLGAEDDISAAAIGIVLCCEWRDVDGCWWFTAVRAKHDLIGRCSALSLAG